MRDKFSYQWKDPFSGKVNTDTVDNPWTIKEEFARENNIPLARLNWFTGADGILCCLPRPMVVTFIFASGFERSESFTKKWWTCKDLKMFVSEILGDSEEFQMFVSGVDITNDDRMIVQLPSLEDDVDLSVFVKDKEKRTTVKVILEEGDQELALNPNSTLGDLRTLIARKLGEQTECITLLLNDRPVDTAQLGRTLASESVTVVTATRRPTFTVTCQAVDTDAQFQVTVHEDSVALLRQEIAKTLSSNVDDITLVCDASILEDEYAISSLDIAPDQVIIVDNTSDCVLIRTMKGTKL